MSAGNVSFEDGWLKSHKKAFLADPSIKQADKDLIEQFILEYGTSRNHNARTTYKYYSYFKNVLRFLEVPLQKMTYPEYLRFRRALKNDDLKKTGSEEGLTFQGEPYSESSKEDFDSLLRRVLRWQKRHAKAKGKAEIERILEESPFKQDKSKVKDPVIFTEDEILRMIKYAENPRDRALIAVLWETGARISELMTLTIGSLKPLKVDDKEHGFIMAMEQSKTTKRTLPLIESAAFLKEYLNTHPEAKNPEAPLWITRGLQKPLNHSSVLKIVKSVAARAKIKKRVYNHLFRHSRATFLADKGWSEVQLCSWFGWKIGSDMPATYIRRSGINLTNVALEMHGLKPKNGESEKSQLLPLNCYFCKHPNPSTNSYCEKCGKPLDPTKIAESERNASDVINALVEAKINEILVKKGLGRA